MFNPNFGSIEKYKMLEYLTEKISVMDGKHRKYLSSVIIDINTMIKKTNIIEDKSFKIFTLTLIEKHLSERLETNIKSKYDAKIFTYLVNYLKAKIKNTKKNGKLNK